MASLIGAHYRSNGIKQIPSRAVLSLNGVGLGGDETHQDTIAIVRDTRVFPAGETTPDFNTYDGSDWPGYGRFWYEQRTEGGGNFKTAWSLNPATYYQIQNERGGGGTDEFAMQRTVDIERAICWAANADGRKCCILNLAGGSPDFESWKRIYVPFIMEAWAHGGNIYGRHCYADKFVNDDGTIVPGQPQRVIDELEYLRSIGYGGGVVLTECGLFGGYGVADYDYFEQQVTRWEQALRPYADILIGLCWWECGSSEFGADYTAHLKQLLPYIEAGDLPRWTPPEQPTTPPDGGEGTMTYTIKRKLNNDMGQIRPQNDGAVGLKTLKIRERYFDQTTEKYVIVTVHDIILDDATTNLNFNVDFDEVVELPDEPVNPNPPPVVLTLPQGSKGVDVSYWQGSFNWAEPGAEFGIIRCSDGMTANTTTHDASGIDRQFWANAEKLTALGVPWAIYHFLRPGSIQAQADKILTTISQLADKNQSPVTAVFDNGVMLPAVFIDVEDPQLAPIEILDFYTLLSDVSTAGIYTGKAAWEGITNDYPVWWSDVPLWIAAYGVNDGNVPPWPDGPFLPRGWDTAVLWQYGSNPIDKNIAGPYPPPPTGQTIDTLPYFVPAGQYGPKIVMKTGDSTQPMQLEKRANDIILRKGDGIWIDNVRYQDSEQWRVKDGQVQKGIDTSDAGNGGRDGYDLAWAQWIPQFVSVGQTYHSTPMVQRFDRTNNCQVYSTSQANDYLYIKEIIPTWTSPANPAIVLNDVLVIEWRSGTPDLSVPPNETYYFAKGFSYVGWGSHFIVEITQGQQPLTGKLDCGM